LEASRVLVVLLDGGFWDASVDRSYLRPMALGLAEAGQVVALTEFRRVGAGGDWPDMLDDAACAVDRAAELVSGRSGVPAQLRATVAVGHSSGGQLAVWCPGRVGLPSSSPWFQAVRSISGAVSLSGAVRLRLSAGLNLGDGATSRFLGGTPADVPERYRQADPAGMAPPVPVVLLHPGDDPVVPASVTVSYAATAAPSGASVQLRVLGGADHFLTTTPSAADWPEVLAAIDAVSR
jgi:acetyl esterase/lipase